MPEKKRQRILIRLGKYMFKYKWLLFLALAMTLASNSLALMGPRLSGRAIDAISIGEGGNVDFQLVLHYAGLMLIFYIASSIFTYLLNVLMITISRKVIYAIRQDVFNKLMKLPVKYFDNTDTGDIISRISYDCDTLNTSLSTDLVQILASSITIAGSFIMMVNISPKLVLIFIITIPMSILLTRFITGKTRPLFRLRSKKLGELNGFVEEMITGQKTLKAYIQEESVMEELDKVNDEVVDAYYRSEYYSSMTGASIGFINNLSLTLISVFGAFIYMSGGMTIGNISSFMLYSRKFSGPINEIASIYGELQSAFAAAERVFNLLDEEEEKQDSISAKALKHVEGDLKIKNVDFSYYKDKPVLKNFNLHAEKGNLIAIVGPTGAGKTTLINMLMRFYDIDSGAILLDGNDIFDIKRESLRLSYSMVLQDTWVFYGTIYDNIAYGKQGAGREEVIEAAKAVKMHNYIMRLPKGYDTILTDDGANISKGQMQLLTIARVMLMDSHMLILDEATSNVDTRTEMRIQLAMRELMKNKTCFVVAHRLSTIKNADKILVVDNGNVVESGTHDSLMEKRGFYRRLYEAQFN